MTFSEHSLTVPEDYSTENRLDKYIASEISDTSRTKIQEAIDEGFITVNGRQEKSSYTPRPGDLISVKLPEPRQPEVIPQKLPLDIMYEDDHLLIVNKRAGTVVHPATGHWTGTLVNGLLWHVDSLSGEDSDTIRPGIVHRLDKDTSGLLVVAKDNKTHETLSEYFKQKTIDRTYWAIIWGVPDQESGTITGNIGRDPNHRKRMAVLPDGRGKPAVTHYNVLERFDHLSLVEVALETGRTHQIRVHFAHNNHWVFGDYQYGGDSVRYGANTGSRRQMFQNLFANLKRQCLHAKTLGFEHPVTGDHVTFDSELPGDFQQVLATLRVNCKPKPLN